MSLWYQLRCGRCGEAFEDRAPAKCTGLIVRVGDLLVHAELCSLSVPR